MTIEIFNPENYRTSFFALPTLLTACTMLALGLKVLIGERPSRVSISFFIMTAMAALWLSGYSFMYCATNERVAVAWSAIGHIGIVFIPASVYHFTVAALGHYLHRKRRVWLIWELSAGFLLSVFSSDAFFSGVRSYAWGYYPIYHWMGALFASFFFGLLALTLHQHWTFYRAAPLGAGKRRSYGLLRAFCVAYLGSFDFLAAFGIPLYPFGYLPVLGFIVLVDRTIRQYRLVSITPEFAAKEIINAMGDALLIFDTDGIVRVVNHSACELFGRPDGDIEGVPLAALAVGTAPFTASLAGEILEGKLHNHEFLVQDGAAAVSLSSFVMRDAERNRIATVCIIRDITKEKSAQREIQRHTERQAALYELNLAATSTLELNGVLDVLLQWLDGLVPGTATTVMLCGGADEPLRRVACRGVDQVAWKSESAPQIAHLHPVLRSKDAILVSDIQLANEALDSTFFVSRGFQSCLGLPLIAKDRAIGILSLYSQQVRHYSDEEINFLRSLAGQVAVAIHNSQLYEQTSQQASELEKANLVREDFLGVMSHELRTPLNVISGYARLVHEGVMGDVNAEQKKALDKIGHHADELLFMVNSIMNATKIEAGALSVDSENFQLSKLFDELRALYDYPFGKDIRVEWNYPSDLPSLYTDRDKLKHILQNLVNNALKFTDEGCVTIAVRYLAEKDRVEATVTDTGVGIPPDELPLVFDRFRQADNSKTRSHGGVGLGLHIVKTFSELLHGQVTVASTPGQGSSFTITLPCIDPQSNPGLTPGR
jgi:PAS domain S-box-containing protein